jgi:hypothetical protein
MEKHKWSQEEVDFLRSNVGEYPFASVIRRYNQTALNRGWPKRTWHSIKWKCEHLKLSWAVSDSSIIKLVDVRRMLGWSELFCKQLIQNPELSCILKPFKEYFWYVERKKLARLALLHPELFHGISCDKLYLVIEDMDTINAIRSSLSLAKKSPYTIRCVETGEEWDSAPIAARHFNVSHHTIQRSVEQKRTVACLNLTFERIRPVLGKIKQHPCNKDDQH